MNQIEIKQLRLGPSSNIAINGQEIISPFYNEQFKIYGNAESVLVVEISSVNLILIWEHSRGLIVKVTSNNFKTSGLCGNANGIKDDDFMTKTGIVTIDINQFVMTWMHQSNG